MRVSKSILRDFYTLVGNLNDSKMMYRIPCENNVLKPWQIDDEDATIDVACIDKQKNGEVDVYIVHEFYTRDINNNTGCSSVANTERTQLKEDGLYMDITF